MYVASGTPDRSQFVMLGVIPPKLKSCLPSKSSSVNTSLVIDLTVTEGMNAAVSNACAYV